MNRCVSHTHQFLIMQYTSWKIRYKYDNNTGGHIYYKVVPFLPTIFNIHTGGISWYFYSLTLADGRLLFLFLFICDFEGMGIDEKQFYFFLALCIVYENWWLKFNVLTQVSCICSRNIIVIFYPFAFVSIKSKQICQIISPIKERWEWHLNSHDSSYRI